MAFKSIVGKAVGEAAAKQALEAAAKQSLEAVAKASAEKLAKEAAEKAIKEAAEKGLKEAAEKSLKEAAEKAAKEQTEKLAKESLQKASKEATEKATKEAAEKATKEAAEKASKEAAEKASKEAAEKVAKEGTEKSLKETAKKAAKVAAGLGLVAGGVYLIVDANKSADKINNTPLMISSIVQSPENSGKIRITFSPGMLLSPKDTIKFSGTNSMPNLSPEFIPLSSVIDVNNIEITGKLTSAGTTGIANAKTTVANQAELKAKQAVAAAADVVGNVAGGAVNFGLSAIEKLLGLPPGTIKTVGYIIGILVVLYYAHKLYRMFRPATSAFGRSKKGRASFGRIFGWGKRR